ncbi:hypothetical protein GCM10023215_66020 [Pseudonocardia yuanmonensis]|uniref:PPE family protein n=1 Tax=Pseudonocardia yuanmonensis TaxID=1095914 RepID=A0ABP8XRG4_9PSEU
MTGPAGAPDPAFVPTPAQPPGTFDGAGLASSVADLAAAAAGADRPDPAALAWTAAGAGLDALGFLADPFGEIATAGIGALIEHVGFLREPLDRLAGNPAEIVARATDWHRGATAVAAEAAARARPDLGAWTGPAAGAARAAAGWDAAALAGVATDCASVADRLLEVGATVGAERALIRDTVAAFLWDLARWALASIASAGVLTPLAAASAIGEAATLATRIAERVRALLAWLNEAGAGLGALLASLSQVTRWYAVPAATRALDPLGGPGDALLGLGRDAVVETGKEGAKADGVRAGWAAGPTRPPA